MNLIVINKGKFSYLDELKKELNKTKVDLGKIDSFLIKTGMRSGQKDSWISQIKNLCEVI